MPRSTIGGVFSPARVDLVVDLGDPFLNRVVDGFLKIGTVRKNPFDLRVCFDLGWVILVFTFD